MTIRILASAEPITAAAFAAATPEDVLAQIGAAVVRNPDAQYALAGAVVRRGVNAFNVNTFIAASGAPAIGVTVCNMFPDGNGDLPQQTDGSGIARFQYGPTSAFSTPGAGPFTVFGTEQATKSDPPNPRVAHGKVISDTVKSLGDFGGEHTEIYLQFVERAVPVVVPPATIPVLSEPLRDSVRAASWNRRGIDFNPDAALYQKALNASLGRPETGEYQFKDSSGVLYVGQDYNMGIVFCKVGDWGNIKIVSWL